MSEYCVYIDTVEGDGDSYNHLLRMQYHGKEYYISATTDQPIGTEGSRLWVTWSRLECTLVPTVEQAGITFVKGKVNLCTAYNIKVSL